MLHNDNGGEFKNKQMRAFCESHNTNLVHGAPRTPQTLSLVERNNRAVKENLSNIIQEKMADKKNVQFLSGKQPTKRISRHTEPHLKAHMN